MASSRTLGDATGWWTAPTPKQVRAQQQLIAQAQAQTRLRQVERCTAAVAEITAQPTLLTLKRKRKTRNPPLPQKSAAHRHCTTESDSEGSSRDQVRFPRLGDRVEVKWKDTWFPGRALLAHADLVYVTFPNFSTNWDDWYDFRDTNTVRLLSASAPSPRLRQDDVIAAPYAAPSAVCSTAPSSAGNGNDNAVDDAGAVRTAQLDELRELGVAAARSAQATALAVRRLPLFATSARTVCHIDDGARTAAGRSWPVDWCSRALQELWGALASDAALQRNRPSVKMPGRTGWHAMSDVAAWVSWCSTAVCGVAATGARNRAKGLRPRCMVMCLKEIYNWTADSALRGARVVIDERDEVLRPLDVGDRVRACKAFNFSAKSGCPIQLGERGTIVSIDAQGDFSVQFDGVEGERWALRDRRVLELDDGIGAEAEAAASAADAATSPLDPPKKWVDRLVAAWARPQWTPVAEVARLIWAYACALHGNGFELEGGAHAVWSADQRTLAFGCRPAAAPSRPSLPLVIAPTPACVRCASTKGLRTHNLAIGNLRCCASIAAWPKPRRGRGATECSACGFSICRCCTSCLRSDFARVVCAGHGCRTTLCDSCVDLAFDDGTGTALRVAIAETRRGLWYCSRACEAERAFHDGGGGFSATTLAARFDAEGDELGPTNGGTRRAAFDASTHGKEVGAFETVENHGRWARARPDAVIFPTICAVPRSRKHERVLLGIATGTAPEIDVLASLGCLPSVYLHVDPNAVATAIAARLCHSLGVKFVHVADRVEDLSLFKMCQIVHTHGVLWGCIATPPCNMYSTVSLAMCCFAATACVRAACMLQLDIQISAPGNALTHAHIVLVSLMPTSKRCTADTSSARALPCTRTMEVCCSAQRRLSAKFGASCAPQCGSCARRRHRCHRARRTIFSACFAAPRRCA